MITKSDIETYFTAEKQESIFFMIIGVISVIIAGLFHYVFDSEFFSGAAIPIFLVGIIQLVVGIFVYNRSNADAVRVTDFLVSNQPALKNVELYRMRKVNRSFIMYRWTEIVLLLIAFGIGVFAWSPTRHFWLGVATGLAVQALIMLLADRVAEKRAAVYTSLLEES